MDEQNLNENDFPQMDEHVPSISIWVNAGFGGPSYICAIKHDNTMTLPDGLVHELGMKQDDELEWNFEESTGTIYLKVIEKSWETPDWLED
jgi:hypothetical protein